MKVLISVEEEKAEVIAVAVLSDVSGHIEIRHVEHVPIGNKEGPAPKHLRTSLQSVTKKPHKGPRRKGQQQTEANQQQIKLQQQAETQVPKLHT